MRKKSRKGVKNRKISTICRKTIIKNKKKSIYLVIAVMIIVNQSSKEGVSYAEKRRKYL